MTKDAQVDAVFVEERFESGLADVADTAADGVPWAVAGYDDPGCDAAVDAGEIGFEEVELLTRRTERSTAEMSTAAGLVWCAGKVGLGVDHYNVCHAVLEGVPEWWQR